MVSNLPPGCTSADGGIDHAWEAASETLLDAVQDTETALALAQLAGPFRDALRAQYDEGLHSGHAEYAQAVDEALRYVESDPLFKDVRGVAERVIDRIRSRLVTVPL